MSSDQIGIRITPDFQKYYEKLKEIADAEHISVSHLARTIIIDHLSQSERAGDVMSENEVEKICNKSIAQYMESKAYMERQKEIMRELLKEMAK